MVADYLIDASCTACGACLLTCPSSAFVVGVPLAVDPVRCTDCGACVEVCPADAVSRVVPDLRVPGSRADHRPVVGRPGVSRPADDDQRAPGRARAAGVPA